MRYVIKASGETQEFDKKKIINTLIKAGANQNLAENVAIRVEETAENEIESIKVLKNVLKLLKNEKRVALRYNLKKAIMSLGPDGYFFEKYFSKVLEEYGYKTKINIILKGKIITHEVDILAIKEKTFMIECKYHNNYGSPTTSKEAMYTYARFLDLKENPKNKIDFAWLATNTKCSPHAIDYARGVELKITCWNYPQNESLQELIEQKRLYPITIIPSVNERIKKILYDNDILLIHQLIENNTFEILKKIGIENKKISKIMLQAKELMK